MRGWAGAVALAGMTTVARAQGTKLWSVGRYDEMQRGSSEGVAIRSDGRLEAGPASSLLYTAGRELCVDGGGGCGRGWRMWGVGGSSGGSAAVMRVGADGKAEKVFEGKELGVQAVRVAADGTVYAATSPEGKVYRLGKAGTPAQVVFDPATTAEKPRYLWDVALGRDGAVYVAAGAPAAVYRVRPGGKAELLFRTADQHIRCLQMAADGDAVGGIGWGGRDLQAGAGGGGDGRLRRMRRRREITSLALDGSGERVCGGGGGERAGARCRRCR